MRKSAVRHDDSTTTRGSVIALSSSIHDDGKQIALNGDDATCGNCKGLWKIRGTGEGMSDDERCVVVDGDLVLCPCGKNRVVAGEDAGVFLDCEDTASASSPRGCAESITTACDVAYDEQFRLVDKDTRQPLLGIRYRMTTSSGRVVTGTTDAAGYTERIVTEGPHELRIEIVSG